MIRTDAVIKGQSNPGKTLRKLVVPAVTAALVATIATGMSAGQREQGENDDEQDGARTYAIGLWGDLPYSDTQATIGVPNLIADMNRAHVAFSVHDGDLKQGNGAPICD